MQKALWPLVTGGTLLLLGLGFAGLVDAQNPALPLPVVRPQPADFLIGVLGDSQKGLANLRNITRAVLEQGADLLLHTGDLVAANDDGHYRLAKKYLKAGGAAAMPWVAPGNHDVKGGYDRFRRHCGEPEVSFTQHGVAIVLLDDASGVPPEARHVEDRIAAAGPHDRVVLAMHQPPFDLKGAPRAEYSAFLQWLEKSGVSYLLCGHVHAYLRKEVGQTTVLMNGVGGDSDAWQFDQKVYATLLEVRGSRITDRTIELPPAHELWENVEHWAIGHVAEAFRRRPLRSWGATLLLAAAVGWGWVALLGARKKSAPPVNLLPGGPV